MSDFHYDVGVVGGCGHVGLPLSILFADEGYQTCIYDINSDNVRRVSSGQMPFTEEGAQEMLDRVIQNGKLKVFDKPEVVADCRFLVLIVGTPLDEHLNPDTSYIRNALQDTIEYLRDGQILILRSTVFPGVTEYVRDFLKEKGLNIKVVFCPERVAQGFSIKEFRELPQVIGAFDDETAKEVQDLFSRFTKDFVMMKPMEAELTKLMTNSYRYLQFAIANQFYMIAEDNGLDFDRILHGCKFKYPRMTSMPGSGFAAGPCLVKDTMQLAAFCNNQFPLGHAGMQINEGFPAFLVSQAEKKIDLKQKTAGILGMAFKGDIDDSRDSLSYKLKKVLILKAKRVLCADPFVSDDRLVSQEQVLREADVLFLGTPHSCYKESLKIPEGKVVIDPWGIVQ